MNSNVDILINISPLLILIWPLNHILILGYIEYRARNIDFDFDEEITCHFS